eukprot:scaffold36536_cov229-Amphora_coffeaeformis.AAC.2
MQQEENGGVDKREQNPECVLTETHCLSDHVLTPFSRKTNLSDIPPTISGHLTLLITRGTEKRRYTVYCTYMFTKKVVLISQPLPYPTGVRKIVRNAVRMLTRVAMVLSSPGVGADRVVFHNRAVPAQRLRSQTQTTLEKIPM